MDWRDYQALARALSLSADEASKRSAISRSYYAVFNLVSGKVRQHRIPVPTTGGTHEVIWQAIKDTKDHNWLLIASYGTKMKLNRRKADYETKVIPTLDQIVNQTIRDADRCIKLVDYHF